MCWSAGPVVVSMSQFEPSRAWAWGSTLAHARWTRESLGLAHSCEFWCSHPSLGQSAPCGKVHTAWHAGLGSGELCLLLLAVISFEPHNSPMRGQMSNPI